MANIKPEQVPLEVFKALEAALKTAFTREVETTYNEIIAATLRAWPGMQQRIHIGQAIILPPFAGEDR